MGKTQIDGIFNREFNVSGEIQYTPNIMAIIQYFNDLVKQHKLPEYREISLDYTMKGRQGKERDEPSSLYIDLSESGVTALFDFYEVPMGLEDEIVKMELLLHIEKFIKNQINIDELKKYE